MTERNPALEAELRADPTDWARWLVYADWLAERGDPRGELVTMAHRLLLGGLSSEAWYGLAPQYAAACRTLRWPDDHPRPPIAWRARFEAMFEELRAVPGIEVQRAALGPPTPPDEIARWRAVAGAAWPDGMDELYAQLSSVDLDWNSVERTEGGGYEVSGGVHLPPLDSLWDYARLEGELWFDFLGEDHEFHEIRPIDRFVPEAYAVLYPVPARTPASAQARVAYHYCGEDLSSTGVPYREWLELLMRSRGTMYWLKLLLGPPRHTTWVEEGFGRAAALFPDFDPGSMSQRSPS